MPWVSFMTTFPVRGVQLIGVEPEVWVSLTGISMRHLFGAVRGVLHGQPPYLDAGRERTDTGDPLGFTLASTIRCGARARLAEDSAASATDHGKHSRRLLAPESPRRESAADLLAALGCGRAVMSIVDSVS